MTILFYIVSLIALMYWCMVMIINYDDYFEAHLELFSVILTIVSLVHIVQLLSLEIAFNLIK